MNGFISTCVTINRTTSHFAVPIAPGVHFTIVKIPPVTTIALNYVRYHFVSSM